MRSLEESRRVNVFISCACGQCNLKIWKFDEHNGWKERQYARGHYNKGKNFSEQHKKRIGLPKIGKPRSEETKLKVSQTLTGRKLSEEHRKNIGLARKGTRYIDSDGYWRIWTINGYILEHRYIMEQHLGRKLTQNEVVHHINENPKDNRIENLQVMTRTEHNRIHLRFRRANLFLQFLEILSFEE